MIVRVIVVDPEHGDDLIVYQVPENSRAFHMLTQLLETAGYEWTTLTARKPRVTKPQGD